MPRTKVTIDEKIEKAKATVEVRKVAFEKAKKKYDDAKESLKTLEKKKADEEKKELIDMLLKSDKSPDEIKTFLNKKW